MRESRNLGMSPVLFNTCFYLLVIIHILMKSVLLSVERVETAIFNPTFKVPTRSTGTKSRKNIIFI